MKSPLAKDGETVPNLAGSRGPARQELPSPRYLPMLDDWRAAAMDC
jgi:hypothetical protein